MMARDLNGNGVVEEAAERLGIRIEELLERLARKHAGHCEPAVVARVFQDHFREWIPLPKEILDTCWDVAVHGSAIN